MDRDASADDCESVLSEGMNKLVTIAVKGNTPNIKNKKASSIFIALAIGESDIGQAI